MYLTDYEKAMLDGKFGKGISEAMKIQIAIGEAFDAEHMVEISRAHEAFGATESCAWFMEMFAELNCHCCVPTTCNAVFETEYLKSISIPVPEEKAMLFKRRKEAGIKLDVIPTYCCTPYLQDNVPRVGEIVAFAESSAAPYVNSVCSAKTNRESANRRPNSS